jgi:hypothetical protein
MESIISGIFSKQPDLLRKTRNVRNREDYKIPFLPGGCNRVKVSDGRNGSRWGNIIADYTVSGEAGQLKTVGV